LAEEADMNTDTSSRTILVTESDMKLLRTMLEFREGSNSRDEPHLEMLARELEHASVVPSEDVPPDVITMNSRVLIEDLETGIEVGYTLAFPAAADKPGRLSILAPVGTALLGYRKGDVIEWPVPRGVRRVRVLEVLYQPEADESSRRVSLAMGGRQS
jgi:regulator of nucleoside diphosphate kinase